jgi:ParB family chromosome partitioning protein
MRAGSFETLFGENIVEDAGVTPPARKTSKPNLVSIRPDYPVAESAIEEDARHISVNQIVVNKQHRVSFEEIAELAESIDQLGLIQPLLVRCRPDQTFELVAGERRLRAVKHLGLEMVPCVVRQLKDGEVAALQLAENLMRKSLNPIEEANGFADVIKKNQFTLARVAKMFGRNKSTISRSLALLKLPADIQEQVASGALLPRAARELARLSSEKEQKHALQEAEDKSLTAQQTGGLVRRRIGTKRKPK